MPTETISEKLQDREAVTAALKSGVREAVKLHKMKNLPMAVWQDGKVIWISPDEFYQDSND